MGWPVGSWVQIYQPAPIPTGTLTHDPCGLPIPMLFTTERVLTTLSAVSDDHVSMNVCRQDDITPVTPGACWPETFKML